jgi:hypothetical protein
MEFCRPSGEIAPLTRERPASFKLMMSAVTSDAMKCHSCESGDQGPRRVMSPPDSRFRGNDNAFSFNDPQP